MKILILGLLVFAAGCATKVEIISEANAQISDEDMATLRSLGDKYRLDSVLYFRDYNTEISTGTN